MYLKQPIIRDKKYLQSARYRCCCVCGSRQGVVMHHIKIGLGGGTGIKPSDDRCLPLCHQHHIEDLHRHGEKKFYDKYSWIWGDDVIKYARDNYNKWLDNKL